MTKIDQLMAYARLGIPVFPVHGIVDGACTCNGSPGCSPGKHPMTSHGFKDATTDVNAIRGWWDRTPTANVGIRTGAGSGFVVLDVDPRNGGDESLATLEKQHGKLPLSPLVRTGGGGRHFYFQHPGGKVSCKANLLPGLDIKADGGYVVAPPSLHDSGGRYLWAQQRTHDDVRPPPTPPWLLDMIHGDDLPLLKVQKTATPTAWSLNYAEGSRNSSLTSLAGTMRRRGMEKAAIETALLAENQEKCQPPLPDSEVRKIAQSVARYQPDETSVSNGSARGGHSENSRPDPVPLPDGLTPVPAFDLNLLPDAALPWVEDIAERLQIPPDYVANPFMVCLGSVVGNQVAIRPRRHDDFLVVPNLWGGVVGRPGCLKSPALQECTRILKGLDQEANEGFQQEEEDHQVVESVVAASRRSIIKQASEDPALCRLSRSEIVSRLNLPEEPHAPVRRRYVIHDTTVEKVGELLRDNPRGLLLFRDELAGFLASLNREGQEGARSFYLEAWSGTGSFSYDRIGRGTIDIPHAVVSVLGSIQPGPLRHYLNRFATGQSNDGLIQRFQLFVWPDEPRSWKNVDRVPDLDSRRVVDQMYRRLNDLKPEQVGVSFESGTDIPVLRFDHQAQGLFDDWRASLERRLREWDGSDLLQEHLSKYRSLVPSLALLAHLADGHRGRVGVDAIQKAIGWSEYLEGHARRVYGVVEQRSVHQARLILAKMQKGDLKSPFTAREVYRPGWSGLTESRDVREALEVLEDHGWVWSQRQKTGGKDRVIYHENSQKAPPATDITDTGPSQPLSSVVSVPDPGTAGDDDHDEADDENASAPLPSTPQKAVDPLDGDVVEDSPAQDAATPPPGDVDERGAS